jgi:hypothetical protein
MIPEAHLAAHLRVLAGDNPPSYSPAYSSELMTVMPALAQQWLTERALDHQRTLYPSHVKRLAAIMLRGTWQPNDPITFGYLDGRYYLLNGQHRLHAIILADRAIPVPVSVRHFTSMGDVIAAYIAFDREFKARVLTDTYGALNLQERFGFATSDINKASNAMVLIANGFRASKPPPALAADDVRRLLLEDWHESAKQYLDNIAAAPKIRGSKLRVAAVVAVGIITTRYQPEQAERFWGAVASQEDLHSGDPPYTLGNYISGGGMDPSRPWSIARGVASAWNAYIEERPLYKMGWRHPGNPIFIAGTPYLGQAHVLPLGDG